MKKEKILAITEYGNYHYQIFTDRVELKLKKNAPDDLEELKAVKIESTEAKLDETKIIIEKIIDSFSWQDYGERDGYKIFLRFSANIDKDVNPHLPGNWLLKIKKHPGDEKKAYLGDGLPDPITALSVAKFLIEQCKNSNWL